MARDSTQAEVAMKFDVSQAMLSRWVSKKDEIFKDAAESIRKSMKKERKSTKYTHLYQKRFEKFK